MSNQIKMSDKHNWLIKIFLILLVLLLKNVLTILFIIQISIPLQFDLRKIYCFFLLKNPYYLLFFWLDPIWLPLFFTFLQ